MRTLFLWTSFGLSVFSPSVWALQDPNLLLNQWEEKLGRPEFHDSFRTGQSFEADRISCLTPRMCEKMKVRFEVGAVEESRAKILSFSSGDPKSRQEQWLQRADWDRQGGDLVRIFFQVTESYGLEVTLESLEETRIKFPVNGVEKELTAYLLKTSAKNALGQEIKGSFLLSPDIPGLGQVLDRRETRLKSGEERTVLTSYKSQ